MKRKQQSSNTSTVLAMLGATWFGTSSAVIGNMAYIDSQRPAVVRVEPAVALPPQTLPPQALAPEPLLPPCDASAIVKPEDPEPGRQLGRVKPVELNVRATPGGRIVGQVYEHERAEILERRGGWLRIYKGWVAAQFVDVHDMAPAPAASSPEQPFPCLVPGPWCPAGAPTLLPPLPPLSQR